MGCIISSLPVTKQNKLEGNCAILNPQNCQRPKGNQTGPKQKTSAAKVQKAQIGEGICKGERRKTKEAVWNGPPSIPPLPPRHSISISSLVPSKTPSVVKSIASSRGSGQSRVQSFRQLFSSPLAQKAFRALFCSQEDRIPSETDSFESNAHFMFPLGIVSPPNPRRTPSSRTKALHKFSIDTSRAKSNAQVVSYCARKLGIQEFQTGREDGLPCDIYWHSVVYPDMGFVVKNGANVNKFPGMTELAKKISLTQAIRSMRELFPAEYSFYPESWILPAQLAEFRAYCDRMRGQKCFIVKPDDGAQGTGIYLINSPDKLASNEVRQLVQEYVPDPYLLPDQLKFDLRIYAVIRSINPLSIYVAREGMARFCTEKYPGKPNSENFGNLYAHLTNYSLNKGHTSYVHSKSLKEQLKGSKRLLSTVFHQMEHKGVRTRRLWREIKLIIVKTVLAMVPEMMLNYEHQFSELKAQRAPQCFQIMGFDIIVRQNGMPILLEVNSSPSLSVEHENTLLMMAQGSVESATTESSLAVRSIVDEMIKIPLVRDSLLLVLDQLEQYYPEEKEKRATKMFSSKNTTISGKENAPKWDIQSLDSLATTMNSATFKNAIAGAEDDLGLLKRARRPHLSEVFPTRYAQSANLLVLDRAVYLYLQFVSIRQSLLISLPTIRAFIRKCELANLLSVDLLDAKFFEINAYFSTGPAASGAPALPFHGFLQILFHLARLKFGNDALDGLMPSFIKLLAHCDSALRRYGVRSTRLRRAELRDENGEEKQPAIVNIYLLPSRMPNNSRKPLEETNGQKNGKENGQSKRKANVPQQHSRAKSLPQRKMIMSNAFK